MRPASGTGARPLRALQLIDSLSGSGACGAGTDRYDNDVVAARVRALLE